MRCLTGLRFFEKNAKDSQPLSPRWCNAAPMLCSDASVNSANSAPNFGCARRAASASFFFDVSNLAYDAASMTQASFLFYSRAIDH